MSIIFDVKHEPSHPLIPVLKCLEYKKDEAF